MAKQRNGHFSERQLGMIEMRAEGKTYREIADVFGLTVEGARENVRTAYHLLKRRGLDALPEGCTTKYSVKELINAGELVRRKGPRVKKRSFAMQYQEFEYYVTEKYPIERPSPDNGQMGKHKGLCCEIYRAVDDGLRNPLAVFDLVENVDIPGLSEEAAIQVIQDYIGKNYDLLMEQAAAPMDRFLKINGSVFSFDEIAKALGIELQPNEPVKVDLCQRVKDGVLVARGADRDGDDYPSLDVGLELPPEKNSMPVMITRTEQPAVEGEDKGVRTFCFSREEEYFMYFASDTRSDEEVDKDFSFPTVVVSGGPGYPVEVASENPYFHYIGQLPPEKEMVNDNTDSQTPAAPEQGSKAEKFFEIFVEHPHGDYDYSIFVDGVMDANEAVEKAVSERLFEEPEHIGMIDSVEEISQEDFQKATGQSLPVPETRKPPLSERIQSASSTAHANLTNQNPEKERASGSDVLLR